MSGNKIETSLNVFLFTSRSLSFRDLRLWIMKTQTPKTRPRKLRLGNSCPIPLEIIKKNGLKSTHFNLITWNVLWSRNVHRWQQPEIIYLPRFIAVTSGGYKTDFNLNNICSDSVSSISSVKTSPANAIKISATIFNLVTFSLFNQCDSDKPEEINILLLSACCLWTLHGHKTLGDKNWDEFT